jgi:hypothetical protein
MGPVDVRMTMTTAPSLGPRAGAAGDVLRRALAPFRMIAEGTGYRMTGALDLGVCSEKVAGA